MEIIQQHKKGVWNLYANTNEEIPVEITRP